MVVRIATSVDWRSAIAPLCALTADNIPSDTRLAFLKTNLVDALSNTLTF
jgi:hypothetical protein